MSDDKSQRRPQDSQRINLSEDYEVSYWTKELGVSREHLEKIVKKVGPMVSAVKKEIGNR
ncbi:DUF3606 domain-containing protein [Peredibacter starrii]|uniref:DUF3606 domain-containing protein n=1 Tax=Peredibacter starrii TaxID=28202 RepID=A0AAX4HL19_9BACT|nr:DUF3606 domain-containing protein [Peredibacter starrii]WPU63872.1 DUF3606 domain-containing protein [Peredibacter starrii]